MVLAVATAACLTFFFPVVRFFLDLPSFLITVGGTALVTLVSFSLADLSRTVQLVVEAFRFPRPRLEDIVAQIRRFASLYQRDGVKRLEAEEQKIADPFMQLAVAKVADWQNEGEIVECLGGELTGFQCQVEAAGRVLQTVGRLLPAFGLIGTLISLVLLLRATAVPDPLAMAPSLSLAILTTLYGALLANAVVLPLATKVENRGEARLVEMNIIAQGAVMMARNERPAAIGERLSALARAVESNRSRNFAGPALAPSDKAGAGAPGWALEGRLGGWWRKPTGIKLPGSLWGPAAAPTGKTRVAGTEEPPSQAA